MGAPGWEASLLHRGDVVRRHSWPCRCEPDSRPWSADGEKYVILGYEGPAVSVHEPGSDRVSRPRLDGFPHSAQWAPGPDRLLVSLGDRAVVLEGGTDRRAEARWRVAGSEWPTVAWLPPGERFFAVGRETERRKTQIRFYSAADGSLVAALDLDPRELVPYDEPAFAHVPRERYSLSVGPGTLAVGSLLDVWNEVRYDEHEGLLLLSVYRPTRQARDAGLPCPVSERWIGVHLTP